MLAAFDRFFHPKLMSNLLILNQIVVVTPHIFSQERQALKKLENIRNDHSQRLTQLQKDQLEDRRKGELIEMNSNLVDKALMMIRSAIANQVKFGFAIAVTNFSCCVV